MKKNNSGQFLIEILLAIGLLTVILSTLTLALFGVRFSGFFSKKRTMATFLLTEILEGARGVWREDWKLIPAPGVYHLEASGSAWQFVEGEEEIDGFVRKLEILPIFRDSNGSITESGGILDSSTKKVVGTISWENGSKTLAQSIFLTRYRENDTWVETTYEDFVDGIEDATDVTTNPGAVQLAETGGGGWQEPGSIGTVDAKAKASGIWATPNYIYLTLDKLWGEVEVFDIFSSPATPSSLGTFTTVFRANNITIWQNYAYVANNSLVPSVVIYDVGQDPVHPPFVGYAGIFYRAETVWAENNILYVGVKDPSWANNVIVAYSLSPDPTNPQLLGWFYTKRNLVDIAVSGNYLYAAMQDSTEAVEVFDLSGNPANPSSLGTFNTYRIPTGIWVDENVLYLSMEQKRAAMYRLDVDPTRPRLLGIFPTVRNSADIASKGDYGYVAGADSQLKAIEVFNLADSKGTSGIYFVYGEYLSSTLSAPFPIAFNYLYWDGQVATASSEILFQVASNFDCATWNFVGPDGSPITFFPQPGPIPLQVISGTCFKYKIILTGDGDTTPVVNEVVINYSETF